MESITSGSDSNGTAGEPDKRKESAITSHVELDASIVQGPKGKPLIIHGISNAAIKRLQGQIRKKLKDKRQNPMPNVNAPRMQKVRQRNGQDKENKSPEHLRNMTLTQKGDQTQGNGNFNTKNTPEYNIKVTNKYLPLVDVTNQMDTDPEEAESLVKELRTRNLSRNTDLASTSQNSGTEGLAEEPQHMKNAQPGTTGMIKQNGKTKSQSSNKNQTKEGKLPPLNILFQDPMDTERLIVSQIKNAEFVIKRINEKKHVLQMYSLADYHRAKKALESVHACFYTFTPKKEKTISVILKGIDHSYDPQIIFDELNALNIEEIKFQKVIPFKTKRSVRENIALPMFIVQLEAGSKVQKLQKINRLCHHVIKWEKFKSNETIQCKRCQRLGHTASNCNLRYRCVKCSEPHMPGKCHITPDNISDRSKLYCANCNSHGHPASYRGCPVILELKRKMLEKKNEIKEKREKKLISLNNYVKSNVSFAETIKGTSNQEESQSKRSPLINSLHSVGINDILNEFKTQILTLIQKQQEQINNIATLIENTDKKINYVLNIIDNEPARNG